MADNHPTIDHHWFSVTEAHTKNNRKINDKTARLVWESKINIQHNAKFQITLVTRVSLLFFCTVYLLQLIHGLKQPAVKTLLLSDSV